MTEEKPTVDQILATFRGKCFSIRDQLYQDGNDVGVEVLIPAIENAKQSLYQALLDVIGDDENEHLNTFLDKGKSHSVDAQFRNQLRHEQRQRLKDLFGVEEKTNV